MAMPVNPYVAGNPVGDSPAFVGRADVLREVLRVLRRPQDNAIVLFGQRRIGKTSILEHLAATLPNEGPYRTVYFDLQDKVDWPLARVLQDLARTIAHAQGQPDPNLGNAPEITFRDEWLPAVLDDLPEDCSLVLLFDEFDVLADPQKEQAASTFFSYLRNLLTRDPGRLQFVFVIGRNVDDLDTIALSLFKGTPYQRVSLLNQEDTFDLVRLSEINDSLYWPDEAVERVWQLTNGHPFLTQQLCSHVWEQTYDEEPDDAPTVLPDDVDEVIHDTLDASRNTLEWLWDGLPPAERVVASALAEAGPHPITQDELERLLHESGVRVVIRELQHAPQLLQEWDLIEPADGGYRFRVELLRYWIAEYKPLNRVQEELDRVEPAADSLYQAGSELYRSGQLDRAVALLRQAIELNPNHVRANQLLADILLAQKQPVEARERLERLYEYQPTAARHRLVKALLAQAQATENDDEQLALYEKVLALDQTQSDAIDAQRHIWQQRGAIALENKDFQDALVAYRKAGDTEKTARVEKLCQEEEDLASFFDEGLKALKRQDWEKAQYSFVQVVYHRPDYQKSDQRASWLLDRAVMRKKPTPLWLYHLPGWAWALVGMLVLILAVGGGWALSKLQTTLTPTLTPTVTLTEPPANTPTPTAPPPPTSAPTNTNTPTITPTPTPTITPTPTPTIIPTQILPTDTPIPAPVVTPELLTPSYGSTVKTTTITFEWSGSLGAGQAYQVTAYRLDGNYILKESLTTQTWTVQLPPEQFGEWRWTVSVVQNGNVITTSSELMFWFDPPGGEGGSRVTPTPTPGG